MPVQPPAAVERERPAWLQEARDGVTQPGKYLAYEESGRNVLAPLNQEWTRIGRSLAADVRFDDATVSRRHAEFRRGPEGIRVVDAGSLNGTYVNNDRVDEVLLRTGFQVRFGKFVLTYCARIAAPAQG